MRKWLFLILAACFLIPSATIISTGRDYPEMREMKRRHKEETKALKLKQHFQKESMKHQQMSPALRDQMKHQMEREERDLRQRQQDETRELKDRMRVAEAGVRAH